MQFYDAQGMANLLRADFPQLKERVPEGEPSKTLKGKVYTLSAAKAEKELGIKREFIP